MEKLKKAVIKDLIDKIKMLNGKDYEEENK